MLCIWNQTLTQGHIHNDHIYWCYPTWGIWSNFFTEDLVDNWWDHSFPQLCGLIATIKISRIMQGQCPWFSNQLEFKQQISTVSSVRWNDILSNCMFSNHWVVGRQQKRQQWGKTGGSLARRPPRMFGSSFTTILSCCPAGCCCTLYRIFTNFATRYSSKLLFVQCPLPITWVFLVFTIQLNYIKVCTQCIAHFGLYQVPGVQGTLTVLNEHCSSRMYII